MTRTIEQTAARMQKILKQRSTGDLEELCIRGEEKEETELYFPCRDCNQKHFSLQITEASIINRRQDAKLAMATILP